MSTTNPGDAPTPRVRRRESGGLASRIESISKATPPPPKGKGFVMILIALAVLYALYDTFTHGSSAARQVEEQAKDEPDGPPLAPPGPDGVGDGGKPDDGTHPPVAPGPIELPGTNIELPEGLPAAVARELRLNLGTLATAGKPARTSGEAALRAEGIRAALRDTPKAFVDVPDAQKAELRGLLLEALVPILRVERHRRELFEAAAWLAQGSGEESEEALLEFYLSAYQKGLASDKAAPGAIAFLNAMPGTLGGPALAALDRVILDSTRPLHVRVLAAHVRPADGRSPKLLDLAKDAKTHPSLRAALSQNE